MTLCSDCPSIGYPTDKTRCAECPRLGTINDASILILLRRLRDSDGRLARYQINPETDVEVILEAERRGLVDREIKEFAFKTETRAVLITDAGKSLLARDGCPCGAVYCGGDHRPDKSGLDDGPDLYPPRKKPTPKSPEVTAEIRSRAWAMRRAKYGERGHR
jgi:hypothetical protein